MKVNETVSNVIKQKKVSQTEPIAGGNHKPGDAGDSEKTEGSKKLFMKKLMKAIKKEPEVRSELVQKYKDQIKSGDYKMHPKELASRIMKESIEELQNT